MKPRVEDFVANEVLPHDKVNTIQTRAADLTKNGGTWLTNEPRITCPTGLTQLIVGPHGGVVIGGIELAPNNPSTGDSVLFNNQFSAIGWWYLYAFNPGDDSTDYQFSQTVPNADLVFKTGSTAHRYVCAVYVTDHTSGAERVIPFFKTRERTMFRISACGSAELLALLSLNGGAATSYTDVTLRAPPTAFRAIISFQGLFSTNNVSNVLYLRTKGDSGDMTFTAEDGGGTGGTSVIVRQHDIETDTSQKIQYHVDAGGTSPHTATINTLGFVE